MYVYTIEVEMTEHEEEDEDNDKVKIINPTSSTETQKTDDEMIITTGGKQYDEFFNDQWNLSDIDDKKIRTLKETQRYLVTPIVMLGNEKQQMKL